MLFRSHTVPASIAPQETLVASVDVKATRETTGSITIEFFVGSESKKKIIIPVLVESAPAALPSTPQKIIESGGVVWLLLALVAGAIAWTIKSSKKYGGYLILALIVALLFLGLGVWSVLS